MAAGGKKLTDEDDAAAKAVADLTLAKRWAATVRFKWAFFEGAQWYRYEGNRWLYSSQERAEAELQHWLERERQKGREAEDKEAVSITARRLAAILRLSRAHLGPHDVSELNAHPTWIPLANGVYDTETGNLIPHSPKHWLTNQLPFAYDPGATCPRWEQFLGEVLIDNYGSPCEEWIRTLQEWFGYCCVPDNRTQVAHVWVGEGQNGKGVATRLLQQLVGVSQWTTVPIDQLHDPYHRAELQGKLIGFVDEPDPRSLAKNGAHFKAITGEDAISARRPTEKVFTFRPCCRLIISCNAIPATRDLSKGFFRRLLIIVWRYEVPKEERDTALGEIFRSELPGIFNWAMEGLKRFRARGSEFEELPESEAALAEYKLGEDTLAQFIRDECEQGRDLKVPSGDLYRAYLAWCHDNGYARPDNNTKVGTRLTKLGCPGWQTELDGRQVRFRKHIAVREDSPYFAASPRMRGRKAADEDAPPVRQSKMGF